MKRCPNFACTVFASHNSRGAGFLFLAMSVSSCNGCCWEGEEERERRRLCVEGALHWNQDGTICNKKTRGFSIKAAVTGSVSSPTRPHTALCLAYGQALTIGFRHAALFQLNHQLSRRLNHRHSLMEKGFLKPPKTSYFLKERSLTGDWIPRK